MRIITRNEHNYLFFDYELRSDLESQERQMYDEIEGIEANRLLNTSVDDLVTYFVGKYKIEAPQLDEDNISIDQKETKVDVSGDPERFFRDTGVPFYIPGTKITFFVPFTGDRNLFYGHSSMLSFNPPRAVVRTHELEISYKVTDHNAQAIRGQFDATLSQIKQLLVGTSNDVGIFNDGLRQKAEGKIKARREKLLKDSGRHNEYCVKECGKHEGMGREQGVPRWMSTAQAGK